MHPACLAGRIIYTPFMKFMCKSAWKGWAIRVAFFLALSAGALATTVVPPDFDQLVNESDFIVRAMVKSVTSEFRTDAGGKIIITKVALEVREVVAGTPPTEVVLQLLGGKVGDEELVLEGAPRFKVGDEDVLFVRDNGRTMVPLVAMMHGRYPVMKESATGRRYMARENKAPLTTTAEVAQPMTDDSATASRQPAKTPAQAMAPEDFIQRVKATVNPRYVRAKN